MKLLNLAGQKFNMCSVYDEFKVINGNRFWKCKCDCGTIRFVRTAALTNSTSKCCGCYIPNKKRLKFGESCKRSLYNDYRAGARKRELLFELTIEHFSLLTQLNCYYCGSKPAKIRSRPYDYGEYIYNGIDRIDSNFGYTIENSITCCEICNRAKSDLSVNEFIVWIDRINKYNMLLYNG